MKRCPYCAEEIQDAALICRFCNRALAGLPEARPAPSHAPRPTDTVNFARTIAADPVRPGMTLAARYRILERIGSGGMGDVFLAHDAELADMPVAIKVLPALLARNTPSIEGLKREAAIALRLSHPHICRLHNFHSDGDIKFLVMEHLPGQTLEALLVARPNRQMTWDELRPLARHLASALDYAHALRPPIVHGDLKPANIMVTPDGMAKLLDFGIAREIRTSLTRITGREETSGTLPYMSPEQFRGETLSAASDLYSFCAVLYEALAGRPLVNPGGSLAWQIQDRPFDPLTGQTAWVNALLAAGLSKNAPERPATIAALLELAQPPKAVPPPPPVMIAPPPPPVPAPEQPQPIPAASTIPTVTTVTSNPPVQSIPAVPLVPLVPSVAAKPAAPTPAPAATPRKPRRRLVATLMVPLVFAGIALTGLVLIRVARYLPAPASSSHTPVADTAPAAALAAQTAAHERAAEARQANALMDAPTLWRQAQALADVAATYLIAGRYQESKTAYDQAARQYQDAAAQARQVAGPHAAALAADPARLQAGADIPSQRCLDCHGISRIADLPYGQRLQMVSPGTTPATRPDRRPELFITNSHDPLRATAHQALACVSCHADVKTLPHDANLAPATCDTGPNCHPTAAGRADSPRGEALTAIAPAPPPVPPKPPALNAPFEEKTAQNSQLPGLQCSLFLRPASQ